MDKTRSVISQIESLPTLPQVVHKVISLVENPETSASQIAQAVGKDSALVSKILKVVNSAYYGLPRKVSKLSQATVILGFHSIKNLVLTASVFSYFGKNGQADGFDREKFWLHSLGCATASKVISRRMRLGNPEEAFICGLLHDIGKIALDQFLHDEFEKILSLANREQVTLAEAEMKILGADHSEIGAWLCDKWNFPWHIQECVAYHHRPDAAKENRRFVYLVHLSDAIAHWENLGHGGNPTGPKLQPGTIEELDLPEEELVEMIQEILEEYDRALILMDFLN
jgi:putative nucleotidyltransferase with HDIG domain